MAGVNKELFAVARETSIGTVVCVNELPSIEGEEGIVISGISTRGLKTEKHSICFRSEAADILTDILNEWKKQREE